MSKILVPFDGSDSAARALTFAAARVAEKANSSLAVLLVHPTIDVYGETEVYVGEKKMRELAREHDSAILKTAESLIADRGIEFSLEALEGDPAQVIARRAAELGCDSIVMGTHGRGRIANLFLGSVAMKVIHLTPLPVTLVK
jgi:nucleotide-binding universal stress UspA family protein